MADLGNYPPEFERLCDLWRTGRKKIMASATTYGLTDRDIYMASSMGSKGSAMAAWRNLMVEHTYRGNPILPEHIEAAMKLMLTERLAVCRGDNGGRKMAQLGMLATELNKESFTDYIEQGVEYLAEQAEQAGAN